MTNEAAEAIGEALGHIGAMLEALKEKTTAIYEVQEEMAADLENTNVLLSKLFSHARCAGCGEKMIDVADRLGASRKIVTLASDLEFRCVECSARWYSRNE